MATAYKTPGVYLVEKDAFPSSVVEVATAIPAFIGYTAKAEYKGQSVLNKPFRITSFAEYTSVFGDAAPLKFKLDNGASANAESADGEGTSEASKGTLNIELDGAHFRMFDAIRMFFMNGGTTCYIMSVGTYGKNEISFDALNNGIIPLEKEQEPTLVVIPEAVSLSQADCFTLQNNMLAHCGKMKNRFAILDVFDGFKEKRECIDAFRGGVDSLFMNYGAAYYPWLNTSVVQASEVTFANVAKDSLKTLETMLNDAVPAEPSEKADAIKVEIAKISETVEKGADAVNALHRTLSVICPNYSTIMDLVREQMNLMPPSGAIAGIYSLVDNNVGVWKAPANVGVNGVISPAVNLTNEEQEDLNVPVNGKAVNAIRSFIGDGNKVWGARTLDGNSLDWRYVNVRRTMIMLEESIKLASKAFVFEANTSNTWVTMKGMIQNFLFGIWKRGGLAGSSPADAFEVYVGLGETMTPEDILEGILRVTIKVALVRPAEFIELTFQQQQQKS